MSILPGFDFSLFTFVQSVNESMQLSRLLNASLLNNKEQHNCYEDIGSYEYTILMESDTSKVNLSKPFSYCEAIK